MKRQADASNQKALYKLYANATLFFCTSQIQLWLTIGDVQQCQKKRYQLSADHFT